jgi:hypothetical protein|tara:strand:+ start:95 stop:457 length:363 start_codon:yes stop_codon:yes gene_type:complete
MRIRAYKDNILCTEADFGDQTTQAGIIIKSTMGKEEGVVSRWFKVFDVGPDIDWLQPDQWVYVEYGRWTEGITVKDDRLEEGEKLWKVDPKGCLAVSDEGPEGTVSISSARHEWASKKVL